MVALGTLGAVVMCILVLLCMDAVKPKDEQEQA